MRHLLFAAALTCAVLGIWTDASLAGSAELLADAYQALKAPELDLARVAVVESLSLRRDVATFRLGKGTLCLMKPIPVMGDNRVTGAFFVGKGTFLYSPPTRIEKDQLARFFKKDTLEQDFSLLFLRFADSTATELEHKLSFGPGTLPARAFSEKEQCDKYILDPQNENLIDDLLADLLSDHADGFFYSHFAENLARPLFFIDNPRDVEEIRFQNRPEVTRRSHWRQTVNQFHRQRDCQSAADNVEERKDIVFPTHYQIEASIESDYLSAKALITCTVARDSVRVVSFEIDTLITVQAVLGPKGDSLPFVKETRSSDLVVFLNSPLNGGEKCTFAVTYKGNIIDRQWGGFYIRSSDLWYPRCGLPSRATYDLTFHTPAEYAFVSIGKKTEEKKEGRRRVSRWVQEIPAVNASFNLGPFKTHEVKVKGEPLVTVYMSEEAHKQIALALLAEEGIVSGKDMEKQVGADISNSVRFFSELFGPYPGERIFATEIPWAHGESFPGLIHLPLITFQVMGEQGSEEAFRAHEVAHQWWGASVGFKTYHDQWLSEGFAEYAGLWYLQWIRKNNKDFFKTLDQYRDEILGVRQYVLGSGAEAGPIWLGYRTSTTETPGDYALVVYKKGAYVLHMLRNLLIDLKTMNEDPFKEMLRDFYSTYKGEEASTEDFRRIAEKHAGVDLGWFFEQWVYGTDLPTYRFSYEAEPGPDGAYLVTCRVTQDGVPDEFRMYVPLTVSFPDGQCYRTRALIDRPQVEFKLPPLPLKPEKIVFNDFNSVLAKVVYE
jgi:hypothetical protein